MKLKEVMELGGRNLLAWLNPDRDYLPTESWCITHDLARLWDALLRLEDATGFVIPGHMEGAMLRNLHWLSDNPDGLLFVPPGLDWIEPRFELHSVREGLLAFNALVRYRNNRWAEEAGHRYLETIRRCLKPDGAWDLLKFDYAKYFPEMADGHVTDPILSRVNRLTSHGKSIEALVLFYQTTSDPLALELADELARYHLLHTTNPDGTVPEEVTNEGNPADRQSYQYTLCGLLLFGLLTRQSQYVDRVLKTYQVGMPGLIVNESGWVAHDLGKKRYFDKSGNPRVNTESTGATIRLALWLALHTGHTGIYDDVERLLRARIFPGQVTKKDGPENNPGIEMHEIEFGGWGENDYPHAGKGCNPSGTAEIVHTLSAVYRHIAAREERGLVVYLHLDYADDHVQIMSRREDEAVVTVCPRNHENLFIRVPGWAPRETVKITVDGRPVSLRIIDSFAFVDRQFLQRGSQVVLHHALPARETTEPMPAGDTYRFGWRGDEITGIHPNTWPRPYYPTLAVP
jgi:hypothetical protein